MGDGFLREALIALRRLTTAFISALGESKLPERQRRNADDAIVLMGRSFDSTRFLRQAASKVETECHWHAVLISADLRYVQSHAQHVAGIPEARAALLAEGMPADAIDAFIKAFDGEMPPMGLLPPKLVPRSSSELLIVQGDPSFKANNRETLAHAAQLTGDLDEAIAHMRVAVRHAPTKPIWHFKLGALLGQDGNVDMGIAECEIAAVLEPGWELPLVEVGIIYLNHDRPTEALASLIRAQEAVVVPTAHLFFHLGLAQLACRSIDGAAESFERALVLKPGDPRGLNMAAEVRFQQAERMEGSARRAARQDAMRLAKEAALGGVQHALERWASKPPNRSS